MAQSWTPGKIFQRKCSVKKVSSAKVWREEIGNFYELRIDKMKDSKKRQLREVRQVSLGENKGPCELS